MTLKHHKEWAHKTNGLRFHFYTILTTHQTDMASDQMSKRTAGTVAIEFANNVTYIHSEVLMRLIHRQAR